MASTNNGRKSRLSRRRWLQLTGTGAIGALAGCSGDSGGDDDSGGNGGSDGDSGDGGGADSDPTTLVSTTNVVPTQYQYNSYNPNNQGLNQIPGLTDQLAYLNSTLMEFEPGAASNWDVSDQTATITLQEGQTWHNGDEVTAEDLVIKLRIGEYYDDSVWNYTDSVEQVDSHTVELTLSEQVNTFVFKDTLLTMPLDTPAHLYADHLEDLENASSDSEIEDKMAEITKQAIEEPFGNGPFAVDETNTQASKLSLHDGHPSSDDINFGAVRNNYYGGNQGIWQGLIHGEVDVAGVATPPEVIDQFPDTVRHRVTPVYRGMALYFNFQDDVYGDPLVRKALAHVIQRDPAAKNAHPEYWGVDVPTGMPQNEPLLEGSIGDFEPYTGGEERAAELMREAGYEKSDGAWRDSSGDPLEFPLRAPAGFSDWVSGAHTIVSHVDEFGFDAELITSDIATFFGKYRSEGNFRVLGNFWGGQNPYPYAGFDRIYGSEFPDYPEEWDVPMPVGDSGGSTETVVPTDLLSGLSVSSGDQADDLIHQLAWIVNQTLPVLPVWMQIGQGFFNKADWEVPAEDSDIGQMNIEYWIRANEFSHKE